MGIRGDLVLYRTAIKRGYPISDEIRSRIVEKVLSVLETGTDREVLGAAKVLLAADEANRNISPTKEEILAIADELGIRSDVEKFNQSPANRITG